MTSTNTVVANAMAAKGMARNAAPKGLTPTTKLRLKEDFSDKYGSYRKGDVFPMYAMGGINPRFGTMMVPGRGVTLQIPWEKLEVVNAVARNSVEVEVSLMYAGRVQHAMRDAARTVSGVRVTGTNTLYCPNDDAADEVVDILEQAGVPKREISLNAKRVARNANQIEKRFGDVEVLAYDDGGLGVRYVIDLGGFDRISNAVSWDDAGRKCAADARSMASLLEKKAQLVKQAASWLEQNAK